MKRLINATTILSLTLYIVPPFAAQAQDFPKVTVDGQEVLCLPDTGTACPDGAVCVVVENAENCEAKATEAAADQAAADQAAADQAAADQAAADQAAADQAAADQAAADQAAADQAAADQAAADQAAADQAAADQAAADQAAADQASAGAEATPPVASAEDVAALAEAQAAADAANAAAAADPNAVTVEAPVPTEEAVTTLETALDQTVNPDATVADAPVAAANPEPTADGTMPADAPAPADATVTTELVTAEETRASTQEFTAAPATVAPGKKTGLSDFEKVGLVALGALAIGAILKGNRQVVQNTGDRVVVLQPDGSYQVYKDDNALLREPGSTVKTETYRDGSTRTIVTRTDDSQIVTIRDATGRVLQRVAYDTQGRGTVLIDDLQPETAIDVATLPLPRPARNRIAVDDQDAQLRAQMAAADAEDLGRKFSLRQIRTIPQVRYLAATIDVNNITFETNSSAIQATEARKLKSLGELMTRLIDENPGEIFLVEGHTDAVGSAASNLSLSDRRAESVAKALTEYFDVPPENLVVQGYGEGELKVDTQGNERANRRVAVRIITPLLYQAAN